MGYFTSQTDTLALPSNPEFTVTVKRRVKGGDYSDALSRSLDGGREGVSQVQAMVRALMEVGIVSWTLTDDDDNIVPVTSEAIGQLEREDYEFLRDEIGKRSALRPEKDEIPFGNGSGSSSRATKSRPRR